MGDRIEAKSVGKGLVEVGLSKKGLNRKEVRELTDLLRKNMLYQTPRPIFADANDEHPTWVDMRFVFKQQQRILQLIHKAGGWVLPQSEKHAILQKHEEMSRRALGDGVDYDFSQLDYGGLVAMHAELEGIEDLADFRKAIAAELAEWGDEKSSSI